MHTHKELTGLRRLSDALHFFAIHSNLSYVDVYRNPVVPTIFSRYLASII